jgi:predicted CXXCH cytochrome family protein
LTNYRASLILLALGQATLAPLQAQHAPLAEDEAVQPGFQSCALCHELHDPASEAYSLRTLPLPMVIDRRQTPQLDAISRSCLRCHLTNDVRDVQAEFARGAPSGSNERGLLGLDLTDDHPVGGLEANAAFKPAPTAPAPGLRDVFQSRRLDPSLSGRDLRCTTCHDPHDRFGGKVQPEAEAVLCGDCHPGQSHSPSDHVSLVCTDCHALHAGHGDPLMREPTTGLLCDSCHDPTGVGAASRKSRSALPHAPPRHDENAAQDCLTCHTTHR